MIHKVFTVFDSAASAYLQPFFAQTKGLAIRYFTDAVNNEKHDFNRYADSYTLFELGEFDDVSGKFELLPSPVSVGNALEFKKVTS